MTRNKPPAFQFYADDWLAGTMGMSLAARGAYVTLLAYQWTRGPIPTDERTICRILGCFPDEYAEIWEEVAVKFVLVDNQYINERMERVRAEQQARSRAGSKGGSAAQANGKQSGKQNASKHPSKTQAEGEANTQAKSKPPTPTPSPFNIHSFSGGGSSEKINQLQPKPGTHLGDSPEFVTAWNRWLEHQCEINGRLNAVALDMVLLDMSRRGPAKAIADIEFSLVKQAKSILDSMHDLQPRGSPCREPKQTRKLPRLEAHE